MGRDELMSNKKDLAETDEVIADRIALLEDELDIRDHGRLKVLENKYRRRAEEVPDEIVEEALEMCAGNLKSAARLMGVSFARLCAMVDRSSKLTNICMDSRRIIIEEAEVALRHHLRSNDLKAAMFVLSTMGAERGYGQKMVVQKSVSIDHKIDLSKLSVAELKTLQDLQKRITVDNETGEVLEPLPD